MSQQDAKVANTSTKLRRPWLLILEEPKRYFHLHQLSPLDLEHMIQITNDKIGDKIIPDRCILNNTSTKPNNPLNAKEFISWCDFFSEQLEAYNRPTKDFLKACAFEVKKEISKRRVNPVNTRCYLRRATNEETAQFIHIAEKRSHQYFNSPKPCQQCGKKGKVYQCPFGAPAHMHLCKKHLLLLFFNIDARWFLISVILTALMLFYMPNEAKILSIAFLWLLNRYPWWRVL